jgi:hypothetical protein
MTKITKISDKLTKVSDSFTVYMYDNGFMVEASGRDNEDEWASAKILCSTEDELVELIRDAVNIKRDT